jgi:septum formation inhibitor-activating ATPase MinD
MGVWLGLRSRTAGKKVCVVDADFQQADIGKLINAVRPNIADLANHPEDQNPQRITKHLLQRRDLNTDFLLGPGRIEESNPFWITPALYSHAVESLRHLYDYIFVDTPVAEFHHDLFREFVLPHADFLLVPVPPSLVAMMNADSWLRSATADTHQGGGGYDRKRVGIVLNMEEKDVGYDEDQVRAELANWNFLGSVPASKVWRRAGNEGEIVATRNYAEVNEAFGLILAQITGERALLPATRSDTPKKGLLGRLIKR